MPEHSLSSHFHEPEARVQTPSFEPVPVPARHEPLHQPQLERPVQSSQLEDTHDGLPPAEPPALPPPALQLGIVHCHEAPEHTPSLEPANVPGRHEPWHQPQFDSLVQVPHVD